MLRQLYRCAVRLHPPGFRDRFGEEMLSIFDQQSRMGSALGMLADALLSLVRQWILRPQFTSELAAHSVPSSTPDGIPFFATLDAFRPRPSAVINGVVLSAVLFCMTCIAIRYSWIRVLHIQIPGVSIEPYRQIRPSANPTDFLGKGTASPSPKNTASSSVESDLISERLQVDVVPVEASASTLEMKTVNTEKRSVPIVSPLNAGTIDLPLYPYTGDYLSKNPKLKISIRIREGQLAMNVTGQARRLLRPISQTRFTIEGSSDGSVDFIPDDQGRIQALRLVQNLKLIVATRH